MRLWGRIPTSTKGGDPEVLPTYAPSYWAAVETDPNGSNDYVYLTAMVQCFRLNLGESPFFGNFGIPAKASIRQQLAPDYAVAYTQAYFSKFFPSLIVVRVTSALEPTYSVNVVRSNGSTFRAKVAL